MALIQVKTIEGVFTPEQKKEIITRFTDVVAAIEGERIRPMTWVVFEDVPSGEWGIGGNVITTEAIRELLAGKTPG